MSNIIATSCTTKNQTKKIKNLANFFSDLKSLLHLYLAHIIVRNIQLGKEKALWDLIKIAAEVHYKQKPYHKNCKSFYADTNYVLRYSYPSIYPHWPILRLHELVEKVNWLNGKLNII